MKQIIYLGGKKARNYTAPHEETDVIGDCDWKKGEVKTEGVDYEPFWLDENKIVPIPKKQEGEGEEEPGAVEFARWLVVSGYVAAYNSEPMWLNTPYGEQRYYTKALYKHFTRTRKS